MSKKIKTAVLGAGRIGKIHTENIIRYIPQAEIVTIADIFADQLKNWANSLGIENLIKDPERAINDPGIDAVFICSPTDTHSKYIIEAARAGKDIFCEKPIDLDIGKIKEAIEAIESSGVKFQIGFNRRFDHNFRRVHDIIRQGKIGDINLVKITSWDPEPPPLEYSNVCGGIFLDMTIHDFDMARFLSGSEVSEVYANATVRIDPDIGKVCADYDTAITSLKFENGAIGNLLAISSPTRSPQGLQYTIFGDDGTIYANSSNARSRVEQFGQGMVSSIRQERQRGKQTGHFGNFTPIEPVMEGLASDDPFVNEIIHFAECCQQGKEPITSGRDNLSTIKVIFGIYESSRTGQKIDLALL